jgi:hypothetical protein
MRAPTAPERIGLIRCPGIHGADQDEVACHVAARLLRLDLARLWIEARRRWHGTGGQGEGSGRADGPGVGCAASDRRRRMPGFGRRWSFGWPVHAQPGGDHAMAAATLGKRLGAQEEERYP